MATAQKDVEIEDSRPAGCRRTLCPAIYEAIRAIDAARGDMQVNLILEKISDDYDNWTNFKHLQARRSWVLAPKDVMDLCYALPDDAKAKLESIGLLPYTQTATRNSSKGVHLSRIGSDQTLHTAIMCIVSTPRGMPVLSHSPLLREESEFIHDGKPWSARLDTVWDEAPTPVAEPANPLEAMQSVPKGPVQTLRRDPAFR